MKALSPPPSPSQSRWPSSRRLPLLALALFGCVAHVESRPLRPLAPMPREEAVDRAFDFAHHNGYGRVSLRGAQLENDVWQVLLRVKDPFKGRLLVSVDAFGGQVLSADAWHKGHGRDEQGDHQGDNEGDGENGEGHHEHKRRHQRSDEED